MRFLVALSLFCPPCAFAADIAFDLQTARLFLDPQGYARLELAPGTEPWARSPQPAVILQTPDGALFPESVASAGGSLAFTFPGGYACEFAVQPGPGYLLFELTRLEAPPNLERLELFSLLLPRDAELMPTPNGGRTSSHIVTLSAAEINVHAYHGTHGREDADRDGCTHELVPADDAQEGSTAARFTATCNDRPSGWSFSGRAFPRPLDLTGCKAIRAWIHGDGRDEQLKIQLYDGQGGYRDAYFPITFEGWRQVTIAESPLNTLNARRVTHLNLYYNGLPAGQTVSCLIDGIEAIVERDGREEAVLLEGFERNASGFWAAPGTSLHLETVAAHGIEPARFGLMACPRGGFADAMARFEAAAGLPSPRPGGVWNKRSPWVDRSYLFITGFSEALYEPTLAMAKRGGFDMILILQDSWTRSTGMYEVNTDAFPGGLDALVATVNRFKQEGFKVGLHFLAASIYPNDPYLTPVPDPRLVRDAAAELAADIDAAATTLPLTSAPADFPAEDGGYLGEGTVVQIGDELISYGGRVLEPPYALLDCQRGILGTVAAPHARGDAVRHLDRSYGYFLHDMDTTLTDEVAARFAKIANACDVDMLYFDGSERLQGDHWYYNAKLHKTFFDKLIRKDILLQASGYSHYSWHILGRTASADGHGDLKGYLDQRAPVFDAYARDHMPLDIGWYYGYDPSATPDMFEYVLAQTIAYDSSMSFQVSPAAASRHPFTGEILDLIRRYENLRLSDRVPEDIKARLRVDPALAGRAPGDEQAPFLDKRREYRLLGPEGQEHFQRTVYTAWREVSPADPESYAWTVDVPQPGAAVGVQFHMPPGPALVPGPAYGAPEAVVLETFDDLAPYAQASTLEGVTHEFHASEEDAKEGSRCAVYTAESDRTGDDGWSFVGRTFDPPLDLSHHKGIGVWLRGDGNGGQFKLQLTDGNTAADFYIANDYTGWCYQQLARPEPDAIDYRQVRALNFYYNNLPGKTKVTCAIDDVKALPALDTNSLSKPHVELAERRLGTDRTLVEGQYAFLYPDEPWRIYGPGFVEPEPGATEPALQLPPGRHTVRMGSEAPLVAPVRVRVVLQPPEKHDVPR